MNFGAGASSTHSLVFPRVVPCLMSGRMCSSLVELASAGHMFWDTELERSVQAISAFLLQHDNPGTGGS